MDIRNAIAQDVAETMGATVEKEKCDCGWPLMTKPNQGMPYCWGCTVDNMTAQRGRALLFKIQFQKSWIEKSRESLNAGKAQAYDQLIQTRVAPYNRLISPQCPKCGGHITYYRKTDNQQHCRTCGKDFDPPKNG